MGRGMRDQSPAGCLLAAAILVGAAIGMVVGQQTIGLLSGIAVGVVMGGLLWWRGRAG